MRTFWRSPGFERQRRAVDGPRALAAQAVLLVVILGVPYAEMFLIGSNLDCASWAVSPVPIAFIIDALLLVPSLVASGRVYRWLSQVAVPPRRWRGHLAALGRILTILVFLAAVGWSFVIGWWGVEFVCIWRGFN